MIRIPAVLGRSYLQKLMSYHEGNAIANAIPVHDSPKSLCCSLALALKKAFSFPVLLGAFLALSVFGSVCMNLQKVYSVADDARAISIFEGDTWLHILQGEDILKTHRWPTTDTYSFTAQGNESLAFE